MFNLTTERILSGQTGAQFKVECSCVSEFSPLKPPTPPPTPAAQKDKDMRSCLQAQRSRDGDGQEAVVRPGPAVEQSLVLSVQD